MSGCGDNRKRISQLTPITNAELADNDLMIVQDVSVPKTKSITIKELDYRWIQGGGIGQLLSGLENISAGVSEVTVSLGTTLANTNYLVAGPTLENTVDPILSFLTGIVTEKTTTSFKVKFNAAFPTANYKLNWVVFV